MKLSPQITQINTDYKKYKKNQCNQCNLWFPLLIFSTSTLLPFYPSSFCWGRGIM